MPLLLAGCSEELVEPGKMRLVSGHEPDPWTVSPAPVRARVEKERSDGEIVTIADEPAPIESFSLGQGAPGRFALTGLDADEKPRVRARSLLIDPAGFAGGSLPLFVSRAGELARPPGELSTEVGASAVATAVAERYLLLASGGPGGLFLDGYDLAAWQPMVPPPALDCGAPSCVPRSLCVVQGSLTLAVGDGWGFWFDPVAGDSGSIQEPGGLASFADVAGGVTITAPDGSAYLVGGTRPSAPSASVLVVHADGTLAHLALTASRQGAAATWVEGRGLVVVGGGDAKAAGGELLAEGAKAFTALPLAPDEARGAALVILDSARLLRLGGELGSAPAPSVELSLGCSSSCTPEPAGDAIELLRARAFSLGPGRALLVGADQGGQTRAVRWEAGKAASVELRDARRDAAAVLLPSGHVGIAGGVLLGAGGAARSVELYLD